MAEPWASGFARLAALPEFQAVYVDSTEPRFRIATCWARRFGLVSGRGFALTFDLALYKGIEPADIRRLAVAADAAATGLRGQAAELARLQALSAARIAIDPDDALLRYHLDAITAGQVAFGGVVVDFGALGISLAPFGQDAGSGADSARSSE